MPIAAHTFVTPRSVPWFLVGDEALITGQQPVDTLAVVLHGLGQRAADLAADLDAAVGPGQLLLVPEGLSRALPRPLAPKAGASWSTGDDGELDLRDNLAYFDGLMSLAWARFQPQRQVLVGFSQGGLTAARWLAHRKRAWDRVVLWAAMVPRDVEPAALAAGLGDAELVVAAGDSDPFITPEARQALRGRLDSLGLPWRLHRFTGGHEITAAALREVLS